MIFCSEAKNNSNFIFFISSPNTPQSYMEREELAAKLHKAISSLTDTQKRRIMMLANGLSINEIARIEGIAPNAAWKSIDSARSKIKEAIN